MALFGKKAVAKEEAPKKEKVAVAAKKTAGRDLSSVIIKPRITEKAVLASERDIYTFDIKAGASKFDVRDAVIELFKVTPVKVHIVNKAPRTTMSKARGREHKVAGHRKAYVYLKKGDKIDLV